MIGWNTWQNNTRYVLQYWVRVTARLTDGYDTTTDWSICVTIGTKQLPYLVVRTRYCIIRALTRIRVG